MNRRVQPTNSAFEAVGEVPSGRNASGKTYGSAVGSKTEAETPDLVAVYTTDGDLGFVKKEDLRSPRAKNRSEARTSTSKKRMIRAYQQDGVTRAGGFEVG
jgi:hypothetical protein